MVLYLPLDCWCIVGFGFIFPYRLLVHSLVWFYISFKHVGAQFGLVLYFLYIVDVWLGLVISDLSGLIYYSRLEPEGSTRLKPTYGQMLCWMSSRSYS